MTRGEPLYVAYSLVPVLKRQETDRETEREERETAQRQSCDEEPARLAVRNPRLIGARDTVTLIKKPYK